MRVEHLTFRGTDIFLTGYAGAGKDFVADLLVRELGYTRISFADALKEEVAQKEGITLDDLNRHKATWRRVLQHWGSLRRGENPNYWIERWRERRAQVDGPVVVADMRHFNEAGFAWARGAFLVRVTVPEEVRVARLLERDGGYDPNWAQHESEIDIPLLPVHAELYGDLPKGIILRQLARYYETRYYRGLAV